MAKGNKCPVYPQMVNGIPTIKKAVADNGLDTKGGVTLFDFRSPLELCEFLFKHDDIFAFSTYELKRFLKQNI